MLFKAAKGGGSWVGITLKDSKGSQPSGAWISNASVDVNLTHCQAEFFQCVFADNDTGINAGKFGAASKPTSDDCVIAFNRKNGLSLSGSSAVLRRFTITQNGGWGIFGIVLVQTARKTRDVILGSTSG